MINKHGSLGAITGTKLDQVKRVRSAECGVWNFGSTAVREARKNFARLSLENFQFATGQIILR